MVEEQEGSGSLDGGAPLAEDDRWALSPTSRKPVPDLVGDRVLDLVRRGHLDPGDRLPTEPDLARLLGVARSSVRTGLQRLESRGVVEVNRGRGWFITADPLRSAADLMRDRLAAEDFPIADVMEVRIALEGTAAALAATRASKGKLDEIMKLARAHQEADDDDSAGLLRTDEEFHGAVVEASGNAYLQALYGMLTPLVADWRAASFSSPQVHHRSANDHSQITVQLRRGDEVGARIAMTGHLLGLYADVVRDRRGSAEGDDDSVSANLSTFVGVEDEPDFSRATGSS